MASSNFDELTRILATSTSRRQTIRALFASALGGTLGIGGIGAAQAEGDCDNSPAADLCGKSTDNFGIWGNRIKGCVQSPSTCTAFQIDRPHTPPQWVLFRESSTNYTLFAGQRIKGIECYKIWQMGAPNYWQFALNAGEKYLKHPYRIGLAINSRAARKECQLHIHVSCIRSDVQKALVTAEGKGKVPMYPKTWDLSKPVSLMTRMSGKRHFLAFSLPTQTPPLLPNGQNLFQLLHYMITSQQKRPDADMQYQTLVVTQRPLALGGGFYILTSEDINKMTNPRRMLKGGIGAGEQLLDETCR